MIEEVKSQKQRDNDSRPEVNVPSLWLQVSKISNYLRENVWKKPKEKEKEK
jgi:hypothetical protein